jgi:hypothetical protein
MARAYYQQRALQTVAEDEEADAHQQRCNRHDDKPESSADIDLLTW